jgi:hypothetical protein
LLLYLSHLALGVSNWPVIYFNNYTPTSSLALFITAPSSSSSGVNNQYQVFAIIGDNSEEFDDNNNPVINQANVTRGANHMAEGDTTDLVANRAKIRLTVAEWETIKAVVNNGAAIPIDARRERYF